MVNDLSAGSQKKRFTTKNAKYTKRERGFQWLENCVEEMSFRWHDN